MLIQCHDFECPNYKITPHAMFKIVTSIDMKLTEMYRNKNNISVSQMLLQMCELRALINNFSLFYVLVFLNNMHLFPHSKKNCNQT